MRSFGERRSLLVADDGSMSVVTISSDALVRQSLPDDVASELQRCLPQSHRTLRFSVFGEPALTALFSTVVGEAAEVVVEPASMDQRMVDVNVVLLQHLDQARLVQIDARARAEGAHLACWFDRGRVWFGPVVGATSGVTYRDLLDRRLAAIGDVVLYQALHTPPERAGAPRAEAWLRCGVAVLVSQLLRGDIMAAVGEAVCEWDPRQGILRRHRLMPRPDRAPSCCPAEPSDLQDSEVGIVLRVTRRANPADLPPNFALMHAELPKMQLLEPGWANDVLAPSSVMLGGPSEGADGSEEALYSAVAHYCGTYMGQGELRRASFNMLLAEGEHAIDPSLLELHEETVYSEAGFPIVPFTRDLDVWWVRGRSLIRDEPAWVPLSLAYVNWLLADLGPQPVTNYYNFVGLAAGADTEGATLRALEHVVAHDAAAVWWAYGKSLPELPTPPSLQGSWPDETKGALTVRLLSVPSATGVPAVAAVVSHAELQTLNLSVAASSNPMYAATRAMANALAQHVSSRDLLRPDSIIRRAGALGNGNSVGLHEHRSDRSYRRSYRQDLRDLVDPMCHLEYTLDPVAVRIAKARASAEGRADWPEMAPRTASRLAEQLAGSGHDVFVVDVTTPDVAACQVRAVRVVVPGLSALLPAAFPVRPSGRIRAAASALDWSEAPSQSVPFPGW